MHLFHYISAEINRWITKQPFVKEESITDFLLYTLSEAEKRIVYRAFSRHEEASIGADWEWWVLTNISDSESFFAYRFLVQAKKLHKDKDNYALLSYGNKNDLQMDLLLSASKERGAYPLYLFYSTKQPEIEMQIEAFPKIDQDILMWCRRCINGCYVSPAEMVKQIIFDSERRIIDDALLIGHSLGISLCDLGYIRDISDLLEQINNSYFQSSEEKKSPSGIRYNQESLPAYVSYILDHHEGIADWYEREFQHELDDLSGVGIIDLRESINHKE